METGTMKTKGETMIERAEGQFWAYGTGAADDEKEGDIVLLDNVQFIYELSLAELELEALGAEFEVTNGLRKFNLLNKSEILIELIRKKSSYFKTVNGNFTDYYYMIENWRYGNGKAAYV